MHRDNWVAEIEAARGRIAGFALQTPVTHVAEDREIFGSVQLHLKMENLQKTGSFKLRGAANKIFSLTHQDLKRGLVTSSAGNHGLAVATSARQRGVSAEVFLCSEISAEKARWIEACGAIVRRVGQTPLEAELAARAHAEGTGKTYVSPYNDPLVVAGQGTIALELTEQLPHFDAIYVAVGGGGLIGGIGAWLSSVSPQTEVIGCWPENSRTLYESLRAGRILDFAEQPTLSESTAGGVEPGSITFDLCQKVVHRKILVSEAEILDAMRWAKKQGWRVEGAAGVAIAAVFKEAEKYQGKTVVTVCCGGNLVPEVASLLS